MANKSNCPKCGAVIGKDISFCPKCGTDQIANCKKCGAKLSKADKFCPGCGIRIQRHLTFASKSLTYGIFALIACWFPFIGWLLILPALLYGFLALRRVKKGNTLESKKLAIAGIILGFISLAIAFYAAIGFIQMINAPISGAAATNENGMIPLTIYGEEVPLRFTDETTGMPVSGLSIGYAIMPSKGVGAILAIDPKERYSPQIILLEGTKTNEITGAATANEEEIGVVKKVLITKGPEAILQTIRLEQLANAVSKIPDAMSAIAVAAKILDQSGLPVGDYAGKLSIAKKRVITQEDAYIENSVWNKLKEQLIFLAGDSILTKKGAIPDLEPISVSLDVANFIFDKSAISSCGAPNERVSVTEIAGMAIFGCEHMYISDYIPMPLTTSVDGPLDPSKSSVDLVSKGNIGLALNIPLDKNGDAKAEIPEGDYVAKITSHGFAPYIQDIKKGSGDKGSNSPAPLKALLKPIKMTSTNGKLVFNAETLQSATVGEEYKWSLCKPDLSSTSDLCGAFIKTTNPTGGMPPYHFQPDIMGGFTPFGINLKLNGMLTGTASREGERTFRICAVDMAGSQSCQSFRLNVNPKEEPKEEPEEKHIEKPKEPSGNGCYCLFTNAPCTRNTDCPSSDGVPGGCACAS